MGKHSYAQGRRLRVRGLLAPVLLSLSGAAAAQSEESPPFSVSLGIFFTDRDTDTRIDAATDTGTEVDLEDDLGFDRSDSVFRVDAYWRFATNHRIDVSAFDLSRDAVKVIDRDITIGDTVYPIDTEVTGKLDLNIYKAAYTWIFHNEGRTFLGASAGLYIADIGTQFAGPLGLLDREENDITAPLPVFGLRGAWQMSERWALRGSAELFVFEYNAFDGSLYDVFAGVDYSMTEKLSLGLGFNTVRFDLGFDDDRLNGAVDWSYAGGMLYLKFDF
ncbi:MAG TPA: hypothetical protein VFY03_04700 [Woeseiaceae bacterium]|nr:hypothetical protein [Woeseiaceae bacterium]